MNGEDQRAIEDLFDRLKLVEGQSGPRDRGAEGFIQHAIAAQPAAPYYMAQTVIVQNQALEAARKRIAELEAGNSGDGIFSGLFGGGRSRGSVPASGRRQPTEQPAQGGGFLAGAAQTAMGVAGGVLLGNMISGLLFGGPAEAAGHDAEQTDNGDGNRDDEPADADLDAGGDFDVGDF